MKKLNDLLEILGKTHRIQRRLAKYYIIITNSGEFYFKHPEYIQKELDKLGFFDELSLEENLALSIAGYQETINGYIDDTELDFINNFFDAEVTKKLITKMGNEYI